MSNLLKPFGIPSKAWARRVSQPVQGQNIWGPCHIQGYIGGELVFDELGAMPNVVGSWISTKKGIRQLQYEELAKAKGINDLVKSCDDKALRSTIRDSSGIHVWAATLDALGEWLRDPTEDNDTVSTSSDDLFPRWEDEENGETEEEWTWKPPNLHVGSIWYQDRITTLHKAIEGNPEARRLYDDGIRALDRHRDNYTDAGSKCLQLLWWEFPEEHWEDLREGCSMNFIIEPSGKLVMNASMDEVELIAAGKFVDQLVALKVLQPAVGQLRANCPLFLRR
jgi:hypothetical protein